MNMNQLAEGLLVSAQVEPDQLDQAYAAGIRSVLCNRPDGEAADQPSFADIERRARQLGMQARYLPVVPNVTDEQAAQFRQLLETLPGPVLAYCRTGMRSTTLWAVSHAPELGADAVIAAARQAGYDLAPCAPRLQARPGGAS